MTKLEQSVLVLGLFSFVWLGFLFNLQPHALDLSPAARSTLPALPFLAIVAFGAYSLITIGFRLATFNDCNEASAELQQVLLQSI